MVEQGNAWHKNFDLVAVMNQLADLKRENDRLTKALKGRKQREVEVSETFDRFWRVYPRRDGKKAAQKAWNKLNPDPNLVKKIVAAVEKAIRTDAFKPGFEPMPATYLNGRRFEDEGIKEDFCDVCKKSGKVNKLNIHSHCWCCIKCGTFYGNKKYKAKSDKIFVRCDKCTEEGKSNG